MIGLRRVWAAGIWVVAGALLVVTGPACSNLPEGKVAKVQRGEMPVGAKWDGVYFSELYGNLHLKSSGGGGKVTGRWERPHKDRWGEVEGEADGDVMKFTWSEWNRGLVGPNAKKSGKGYFKYKRPEGTNVDDQIAGEIGLGEDEVGDPWEAVKQRNIPPHPENIGGTGSRDVGGGDWDNENKEKGKPERPSSPK
jgi:hypothetical protein